jgi:cell division inhibitor SulA
MNINHLNLKNQLELVKTNNWIDVRGIENAHQLSDQYEDICKKHEINKKWILMINPENQSLAMLSKSNKVDISKILKVNTNKTKIDIKNIEFALGNGNCAAVILCNPSLKDDELAQLNQYAEKGQTDCIVLKSNQQLH